MSHPKDSIRLSEKHGLNPAIPKCFFCLQDKNEVLLVGHMKNDAQAPRGAVWDTEPCDKCKEYMTQGVILVSIDEGKSTDPKNPHRTGGWAVVKEEVISRVVSDEKLREHILAKRVAFLSDEVWDLLGLPRETPEHLKANQTAVEEHNHD